MLDLSKNQEGKNVVFEFGIKIELTCFKTQIHIFGQGLRRLLKCFHLNPIAF